MIETIIVLGGLLLSGGIFYFMDKRLQEVSAKVGKAESEAITAKGYQQNAEEEVVKLREVYNDFVQDLPWLPPSS